MSNKRGDAPKIVNIGVWAAAVVGASAFALTVGIGLYNTVNTPISADTATTSNCPSGSKAVALNNYPTQYFKTKGADGLLPSHAPYEKMMGDTWRCSVYCVPNLAANADTKAIQEATSKYLTGATIDGKAVNVVDTESKFTGLLSDKQNGAETMARTVILPSLKGQCDGATAGDTGWSINYPPITIGGKKVEPAVPNKTAEEGQKALEKARKDAEAKPETEAPAPAAPAPAAPAKPGSGPAAPGNGAGAEKEKLKTERENFKTCKAKLLEKSINLTDKQITWYTTELETEVNKITATDSNSLGTSKGAAAINARCKQAIEQITGKTVTEPKPEPVAAPVDDGTHVVFYLDTYVDFTQKPTTAEILALVYEEGNKTPIGGGKNVGHSNRTMIKTNLTKPQLAQKNIMIIAVTDGGKLGDGRRGMIIASNKINQYDGSLCPKKPKKGNWVCSLIKMNHGIMNNGTNYPYLPRLYMATDDSVPPGEGSLRNKYVENLEFLDFIGATDNDGQNIPDSGNAGALILRALSR